MTAFRVNHPVETYGYRVEADGAVLAYSGDTDACQRSNALFTGADLLLVDAAFVDGRDEPRVSTSRGAARRGPPLTRGECGRLVLTHIPPWNDPSVPRPGCGRLARRGRARAARRDVLDLALAPDPPP